jgi:hypothetical protein
MELHDDYKLLSHPTRELANFAAPEKAIIFGSITQEDHHVPNDPP